MQCFQVGIKCHPESQILLTEMWVMQCFEVKMKYPESQLLLTDSGHSECFEVGIKYPERITMLHLLSLVLK